MQETEGRNRYYHCEMLLVDIAKRDKKGDTRAAIYIDDAEATILTELLQAEMAKDEESRKFWAGVRDIRKVAGY